MRNKWDDAEHDAESAHFAVSHGNGNSPLFWSLEIPCFHLNSIFVGCLVAFFVQSMYWVKKINPSIHLRWLVIYICIYIHITLYTSHWWIKAFVQSRILHRWDYIYIYLYVDIYIYDVYPCISHILWIHDVYPIYYGLYFILFRIHPLIYPLTYPPIYWDIVDIRVMHMPQTLWLFNIAMETDP